MHYKYISDSSIRNYYLGSHRTFHQGLTAFPVSVAQFPSHAVCYLGANSDSGVLIALSGKAMVSPDAADGVIRITQGPQERAWKLGGNDFAMGTSVSASSVRRLGVVAVRTP